MNKEIKILVEDQLIPIKNNDGRTVVNARDLHEFLESRKDFSSWIKDRIERYDLAENEDYVVFTEFGENSKGGRPKKEYALTLDAAKELSMVEGNEKGKQARKYFIACEKKLKGENPSYLIADPIKRAEAWIQEEKERQALKEQTRQLTEENKNLEAQIEEDLPKVIFAMAVTESKRSCLVAELAKIICQNGMEVGQNRLFKWLRKKGYLGTKGEYYNQPMQRWVEAGMFEIKKKNDYKTERRSDYGKYTSCNWKRSSVPREQVLERIYFKMKMKNHSICHNIMLHFSLKILFDILYCDKSIKSLLLINTLSLSPTQMLKSKIHILDLKITLF